jgi:hypothetical protein
LYFNQKTAQFSLCCLFSFFISWGHLIERTKMFLPESGRPDLANFSLMDDCLLWEWHENYRSVEMMARWARAITFIILDPNRIKSKTLLKNNGRYSGIYSIDMDPRKISGRSNGKKSDPLR